MHFRTVSCFPIWDLLCTPVWALYGKEILGGHSFGVSLSALTAVTAATPRSCAMWGTVPEEADLDLVGSDPYGAQPGWGSWSRAVVAASLC